MRRALPLPKLVTNFHFDFREIHVGGPLLTQMNNELMESPRWMRLMASPSSLETVRIFTLGQALTSARGGIESVMMSSLRGDLLMRSMAAPERTPWLAQA